MFAHLPVKPKKGAKPWTAASLLYNFSFSRYEKKACTQADRQLAAFTKGLAFHEINCMHIIVYLPSCKCKEFCAGQDNAHAGEC